MKLTAVCLFFHIINKKGTKGPFYTQKCSKLLYFHIKHSVAPQYMIIYISFETFVTLQSYFLAVRVTVKAIASLKRPFWSLKLLGLGRFTKRSSESICFDGNSKENSHSQWPGHQKSYCDYYIQRTLLFHLVTKVKHRPADA